MEKKDLPSNSTKVPHRQRDIKVEALMAGRNNDLQKLPWLIQLLNNPDKEVRASAALALNSLKDPHSIPALIRALHDPEFTVRSSAGWALVHLGDQVLPEISKVLQERSSKEACDMAKLILFNLRFPDLNYGYWSSVLLRQDRFTRF